MCGKSYLLMTGEVASVQAAVDKVKADLKDTAMFLDSSVIANPDMKMWKNIL